jgi:hypothetical protein
MQSQIQVIYTRFTTALNLSMISALLLRAIASNESDRALKDQNEPQRRKDHKGEEK